MTSSEPQPPEIAPAPPPPTSCLPLQREGIITSNGVILNNDGTLSDTRTRRQITGISNAVYVSESYGITAAVLTNGGVAGQGPFWPSEPKLLPSSPAVSVICRNTTMLVVLADGNVFMTTGGDYEYRFTDGAKISMNLPFEHLRPSSKVVAAAMGGNHAVFVLADGRVAACGSNEFGQLGIGLSSRRRHHHLPVMIESLSDVVAIAAGDAFTVAITSDGRVATWGLCDFGRLGQGRQIKKRLRTGLPKFIEGIDDAVAVACGECHTAIVHADGGVSTFGKGNTGRRRVRTGGWLGHGTPVTHQLRPKRIAGISDAQAVACGDRVTFIRHFDGSVSICGEVEQWTWYTVPTKIYKLNM
jgi:alpha-tubulin suppressor-like RCC1 family protein